MKRLRPMLQLTLCELVETPNPGKLVRGQGAIAAHEALRAKGLATRADHAGARYYTATQAGRDEHARFLAAGPRKR